MMRVFVTGGTGLIGRRLVRRLIERGDRPVVLTRHADRARLNPALRGAEIVQGDPLVGGPWDTAVDGCDAVVNLVGHNIFAERWSPEVKQKIRDSRVYGTEHVVDAMRKAKKRPGVLVQSSAIGYYGFRGDEELTESSPPGDDFMARVCRDWEAAAAKAEGLGARVATIRTGVVLARGEGALGVMTPIFWLPGGASPVGSEGRLTPAKGRQWMSWIHLDDIVGIYLLGLDHADARGPINGTAPQPERNADFSLALTKAIRGRGIWPRYLAFGPPDLMLGLALGEVAEIVTKGQKVMPARAKALGYAFRFPDLAGALRDLFARPAPEPRPEPIPAASSTGVRT
jgi:uncharacterized protein (TIGR01777 family)